MTVATIEIDLADIYANAEIPPDPQLFAGRARAVEEAIKSFSTDKALGFVRIAFGLPEQTQTAELVNLVRETDASFSIGTNAQEIRLLAVSAIEKRTAPSNSDLKVIFAVLAISFFSKRECSVDPNLVSRIESRRRLAAINKVRHVPSSLVKTDTCRLASLTEKVTELQPLFPEDTSVEKLGELLSAMEGSIDDAITSLAQALQTNFSALNAKIKGQQNEIDLLWWLFGGWSTAFEQPLAYHKPCARAVLTGIDLGNLSDLCGGPAPVQTFIQRAIGAMPKDQNDTSVHAAVSELAENLNRLESTKAISENMDIFPVLGAFEAARVHDSNAVWIKQFKCRTGMSADTNISCLELAEQVYREQVLVRLLSDGEV